MLLDNCSLIDYLVVEAVVGSKGAGLALKGLSAGTKALIGAERIAQLTTKIGNLAKAVKTGTLRVMRVGGKFKYHTPLTNDVFEEAMRIINTTSAKSRGPCLSGIYDPATGKTYYGINFKATQTGKIEYEKWLKTPAELGGADPIIKQMVNEYDAKILKGEITLKEFTDKKLAAHSELRAFDQALKARREAGLPVDRNSIKEMSLSNRDLQPRVLDKNNVSLLLKQDVKIASI